MRSGMSKEDFFLKCNRKPAQELLYQKVLAGTLTIKEIETCGQPLWVRQALTKLLETNGLSKEEYNKRQLAELDLIVPEQKLIRHTFPVYTWNSSDYEIIPEKGFSTTIRNDSLILIDIEQLQIKVDFTVSSVTLNQIKYIINNGTLLGFFTDADFIEEVGKRR